MNVETKHYIELDKAERRVIINNAEEVNEKISRGEFIELIEDFMQTAFELGLKEGSKK